MAPDPVDARELANAARGTLIAHVERLAATDPTDPARAQTLVRTLEDTVDGALPDLLGPDEPGEPIEAALRDVAEGPIACARATARKRRAELSGALFACRLAAQAETAQNAPLTWHHAVTRVHDATRALADALDRYADATHQQTPPPPPDHPGAALQRARALLTAGSLPAASIELSRALTMALHARIPHTPPQNDDLPALLAHWQRAGARLPATEKNLLALHHHLQQDPDPLVTWRLLDAVETAANRAAMTPWPNAHAAPRGNTDNPGHGRDHQ